MMNMRSKKSIPYNDLDASNWRDYDAIETGTLWNFSNRQREGGHQNDYHGNCVPQILTQLYSRFTKQEDVVLDLFLGSGTSAIEAMNMERRHIGIELKPELAEYVEGKLDERNPNARPRQEQAKVLCGSSAEGDWVQPAVKKALKEFGAEQAQFLFLHPPYADIIRFSELEDDLSNAPTTEDFLDGFEEVARNGYELLEPGRFAAVVIGDKYADGELIPLGFQCMERMNRVGFTTKSIIVKNITGNEKGKGRLTNLWRYRALVGGFYIFKHEYVIVFRKPDKPRRRSKSVKQSTKK